MYIAELMYSYSRKMEDPFYSILSINIRHTFTLTKVIIIKVYVLPWTPIENQTPTVPNHQPLKTNNIIHMCSHPCKYFQNSNLSKKHTNVRELQIIRTFFNPNIFTVHRNYKCTTLQITPLYVSRPIIWTADLIFIKKLTMLTWNTHDHNIIRHVLDSFYPQW